MSSAKEPFLFLTLRALCFACISMGYLKHIYVWTLLVHFTVTFDMAVYAFTHHPSARRVKEIERERERANKARKKCPLILQYILE